MGSTGIEQEIANFENALNLAIDDVMEKEVLNEVKNAMQDAVQKYVYDAYEPTEYVRRGEVPNPKGTGGLKDPDVMEHIYSSATKTLEVWDAAKPVGEALYESVPLREIIRRGYHYDWERSGIAQMQPYPREFQEWAQHQIDTEQKVETQLVKGLKRRGFKATTQGR